MEGWSRAARCVHKGTEMVGAAFDRNCEACSADVGMGKIFPLEIGLCLQNVWIPHSGIIVRLAFVTCSIIMIMCSYRYARLMRSLVNSNNGELVIEFRDFYLMFNLRAHVCLLCFMLSPAGVLALTFRGFMCKNLFDKLYGEHISDDLGKITGCSQHLPPWWTVKLQLRPACNCGHIRSNRHNVFRCEVIFVIHVGLCM